jgi:hypothetical protein
VKAIVGAEIRRVPINSAALLNFASLLRSPGMPHENPHVPVTQHAEIKWIFQVCSGYPKISQLNPGLGSATSNIFWSD